MFDNNFIDFLIGRDLSSDDRTVAIFCAKLYVKRALAEAGLLTLSWYKTKEENKMLIALASKGISNVTQLLERL